MLLIRRLKRMVWKWFGDRFIFNPWWRERLDRQEFFYHAFKALSFNGITGDYVEFGSHGCNTFYFAYQEAKRHKFMLKLWAFDSFQGLPAQSEGEGHPHWKTGDMATSIEDFHRVCQAHGVPRDFYHVMPGFYQKTLSKLSAEHQPRDIALAFIDCDLYSSTREVLRFLMPRLKHGMILAFDDYYCWSPTDSSGERKAMLEFFPTDGPYQLIPYRSFGWHGQSFVLEIQGTASTI